MIHNFAYRQGNRKYPSQEAIKNANFRSEVCLIENICIFEVVY